MFKISQAIKTLPIPLFTLVVSVLTISSPSQAQSFETFSVNGDKALNSNWNFRRIDGNPRMSIWNRDDSDHDQQFERVRLSNGSFRLKHRKTGLCLNAHYLANGRELNLWNCSDSDPDQHFDLLTLSDGSNLIRRRGTNFCVDSPTRDNGGKVHLIACDVTNANQKWRSSNTPQTIPNNGNVVVRPSVVNRTFGRGAEFLTSNRYKFVFQQDGNLVLYTPQGRAIWATGTVGTEANMLSVQIDGNIVLYNKNGRPIWATDTAGNSGAYLAVQTDGNIVVYTSNNVPIFNTGTVGGATRTFTASADWLRKAANPGNARAVQRAKSWVDRVISYNQSGWFEGYRQDCSGLVSMAWELKNGLGRPISPTTSILPQYATTLRSKAELQPGDAINNRGIGNGGHVVLFVRWVDQSRGTFIAYEQNGGRGKAVQTALTLESTSRGFNIREYTSPKIATPWYLERKK